MKHTLRDDLSTITAHKVRWLRFWCRLGALCLGGLHAWAAAHSHSMNADGISYLDLGDAIFSEGWGAAVSPVWSPLYAWLLGSIMWIFEPTMRWEFPLVHATNFVIYLWGLACFEFYWKQLTIYRQGRQESTSGSSQEAVPEWSWMVLGYLIYITAALTLIELWAVTPDLLMAGFVLLAAGFIVRLRLGSYSWRDALMLGAVLGLAYLTKSVMFVLGFMCLGMALFSMPRFRKAIPYIAGATTVFILIITPFIVSLSANQGRFTIGSVSTLTYIRHVNNIPYPHWQGEPPEYGTPLHPSRQVFEDPPVYEFGTPVGGTYPITYNPAYWYEGAVVQYDLANQLKRLLASVMYYLEVIFFQQAGLTFGVILLYLSGYWQRISILTVVRQWGLALIAILALGMYAPLLAEGRYIGVFLVLFWGDMLANVSLPVSDALNKVKVYLSWLMVVFLVVHLGVFNIRGAIDLGQNVVSNASHTEAGPPEWPGEVAELLQEYGIRQGSNVGVIGYAFDSYWARLARVKIVAEMPGDAAEPFWRGDQAFQQRVLNAFIESGVQAIVAESVPAYASLSGWRQVGTSNYYIFFSEE